MKYPKLTALLFIILIGAMIYQQRLCRWLQNQEFINKTLPTFLNANGLRDDGTIETDINGNGVKDYIVETIPLECGSCHSRPLYIFEDGKILFKYIMDDGEILNPDTISLDHAIILKEPTRLDNEPLCCPSKYHITKIKCKNSQCGLYDSNDNPIKANS